VVVLLLLLLQLLLVVIMMVAMAVCVRACVCMLVFEFRGCTECEFFSEYAASVVNEENPLICQASQT
jgi:hypothetical protein